MIISITGGSAKLKDLAESITRYSAELLLNKKLIEKLMKLEMMQIYQKVL